MAERSSADVEVVFWGGYDVRPWLTQANLGLDYRTAERHVLGDNYVYFAPVGIYQGTFGLSGFFDDGAQAIEGAFRAASGQTIRGLIGPSGNVHGRLAIGLGGAVQSNYNIETPKGDFVKASAQAVATGIVRPWLWLIQVVEVVTATGNGTAFNESALFPTGSTSGGVVQLGVAELDLDGAADLTLTLQEGNGTIYADTDGEHVFTTGGLFDIPVTGTIGTHVRVVHTWGAGGGAGKTAKIVGAWLRTPDPAP